MTAGILFAALAGLMWGLVFVAPAILTDYPAVLLAMGRYLAFGLVTLPIALWMRQALAGLSRHDWIEATKLTLVGNFAYYIFLAAAIQRAGGPLVSMIIGTLPVVIAIASNLRNAERDGHFPWLNMAPGLLLIVLGIVAVNHDEWQWMQTHAHGDTASYLLGVALALGAVVCWTWYPLRNADWMRHHPDRSSAAWATAQGLVTLPIAAVGYLAIGWVWLVWPPSSAVTVEWPLGPEPGLFVLLVFSIGMFSSWAGTYCWNQASQRLPTTLTGQLIVFETLAALSYNYAWRGMWPSTFSWLGMLLLVSGVALALRVKPVPRREPQPNA
jgi:drug/metabolite transporter (DMT)-like permease